MEKRADVSRRGHGEDGQSITTTVTGEIDQDVDRVGADEICDLLVPLARDIVKAADGGSDLRGRLFFRFDVGNTLP